MERGKNDGERILSSDINVRTIFKPPQQVVESSNQRAGNRGEEGERQAKGRLEKALAIFGCLSLENFNEKVMELGVADGAAELL
jgi:hypothetical protein